MSEESLTAALAERVMGWGIGPGRFLMENRSWMPRWRFQPTTNLIDAFRLLEQAAPQEFTICGGNDGNIYVEVRIGGTTAKAEGTSKPRTITSAIARALGIEVEL